MLLDMMAALRIRAQGARGTENLCNPVMEAPSIVLLELNEL